MVYFKVLILFSTSVHAAFTWVLNDFLPTYLLAASHSPVQDPAVMIAGVEVQGSGDAPG